MPYRINGILDIRFQGLDLNCGFYCLEAVMRWKHAGNQFGVDAHGNARNDHTAAVKDHMSTWWKIGFTPSDHLADYRLVSLEKPRKAAQWEILLRQYGPLIVGGHIGAVRIIPFMGAGHYIVVIGVNAKNEIEYYDPLRPWDVGGAGEPNTMSETEFDELAYDDVCACQ